MPKFAANIAYLFTERPLIERFAAAAAAGFKAVELQFPYDHAPSAVKAELEKHGLTQLGLNSPPGREGEFGAVTPGWSEVVERDGGLVAATLVALPAAVHASIAYGTLNNFDCVNDTGVEAHGFDIELEDVRSTDITYTYDYNHYGVPRITEDLSNPLHPKVLVRYASVRKPDGTWAAYTAIPSGPIAPTQGHDFTNPSINFGGEHFGVGYYGLPTAVLDLATIEPMTQPYPLVNVFRPDVVRPGVDHGEVMAAAPVAEDGRFRVPPIIGLEG